MPTPSHAQNPSIVSLTDGVPTTTTLVIAEGAKAQHKNVLALVRTYLADLEEFGLVAFETRPREAGQHGGGDTEYAILNERQTTLLFTYMKNTPIVRDFKKRLVREFYTLARPQAVPSPPAPVVRSRLLVHLENGAPVSTETIPDDALVLTRADMNRLVESSGMALVRMDDLVSLCSRVCAVDALAGLAMDDVRAIEAQTGHRLRGKARDPATAEKVSPVHAADLLDALAARLRGV